MREFLGGAAVLVALTACTGTEPKPNQVASLQTGEATASSEVEQQQQPDDDKRPRLRLDDTPEQRRALNEPYEKCMNDNGGIPIGPGAPLPKAGDREKYKESHPKALAKCKHLYPRQPWEFDKNNPESMDFIHRVAECMRRNGAKVKEVPAGPGEDYNWVEFDGVQPQFSGGKGMELSKKCSDESARK